MGHIYNGKQKKFLYNIQAQTILPSLTNLINYD